MKKLDAEIYQLSLKHPTFQIMGEVRNVQGQSIALWGRSVVKTGPRSHWATSFKDTNIVVKLNEPYNGQKYYTGVHSFLEKRTGKNAFGKQVPVLVYGNSNSSVAKQFRELREHRSIVLSKYNQMLLEVVKGHVKKNPENKVKVLIDFLQDGRYLSTALNELRMIGPTVSEELAKTLMTLPEDSRLEAMKTIKGFGSQSKPALPYLIDLVNLNGDKYGNTVELAYLILEESFPKWQQLRYRQNNQKSVKPVSKEADGAKSAPVKTSTIQPKKIKIVQVATKDTDIDKIVKLLAAKHNTMDIPAITAITSKSTESTKNSAVSLTIQRGLSAKDWRMPDIIFKLLDEIDDQWFKCSGATTMIDEICVPLISKILNRTQAKFSLKVLAKIGINAKSAIHSIMMFKCNQGMRYKRESEVALNGISPKWCTLPESESAVKDLAKFINDDDFTMAQTAAELIEKIGKKAKDAVPALVKLLKRPPPSDVEEAIIKALGAIGPPAKEALPTLKSLAKVYYRKTFIREAINSIEG